MVQTDILRHEFSVRLTQALDDAKYPAHGRGVQLARSLGVSSKAVSKWLTGESIPRPAMMNAIAKVLRADPIWLQHGKAALKSEERVFGQIFGTMFPVIEWADVDGYDPEEFSKKYDISDTRVRFEPSSERMTEGTAIWLEIKDDTMASVSGPCIPKGAIVLIELSREPVHEQIVLAKLSIAEEPTLKQYIVDKGLNCTYLKPLNPNYPVTMVDTSVKFLGVAVEARIDFAKPTMPPFPYNPKS